MIRTTAAAAFAATLLIVTAEAAPEAARGARPADAVAAQAPMPPRRAKPRVATRPAPAVPVRGAPIAAPADGSGVMVERPALRSATRRSSPARAAVVSAAPAAAVLPAVPATVDIVPASPRGARASRRPSEPVASRRGELDARIEAHARAAGVPVDLVHHVILRESRYNASAVGPGAVYGLMQIKHGTARALGYAGSPAGLLDPETNLTYGVRYLAGAYRVANGNPARAYGFFRSGYYYHAKRMGLRQAGYAAPAPEPARSAAPAQDHSLGGTLARVFGPAGPHDPAR